MSQDIALTAPAHTASTARRAQTRQIALASLLLLGAAFTAQQAQAQSGPRVGDVVGAPSVVNTTVQARVVSSSPVVAQVAVPAQVCRDETYQTPARSSGAGAVLGAIAGGAAGHAVGKGAGKALATGVGIIGGAILGDHVENDGRQGGLQTVRRCEQQTGYENRIVAHSVTYEYAGQRYTTQMTQEPGPTLPLQVTLTPMVQGPAPVVYSQPAPAYQPYVDHDIDQRDRFRRRWD
jgi:uncharacterized protein YcfJ